MEDCDIWHGVDGSNCLATAQTVPMYYAAGQRSQQSDFRKFVRQLIICYNDWNYGCEWLKVVQTMADRFFQGYIYQLQGSICRTFGVIDNKEIVSCSNQELIGKRNGFDLMGQKQSENECFVVKEHTYCIFYKSSFMRFAVFVEGTDQAAKDYARILSVCFTGMKSYFEEKYNRHLFYQALFLERILSADINVRAKMLKIPLSMPRVVYLLRFPHVDEEDNLSVLIQDMEEPEKSDVFFMTDTDVIVIARTKSSTPHEELERVGLEFQRKSKVFFRNVPIVGIGSIVTDVRQLSESYKEALYALELSYLFDKSRTVIDYHHLGIKRLIYHLPIPLCQVYLEEVFIKGGFDSLDSETLETVKCFFDNNLNISETARKLFVHRNTLMYRLEKIKKLTGLDVRNFDHAIIFKIAMMIHIHMKEKELGDEL